MPGLLDGADELAADLGYLPVALAQAAAVIADDAISCAGFRRRIADRRSRLVDLFPDSSADHYGRTLAATWALALDRADALPPTRLASHMAVLAATLDPNGIPESVVASESACGYLATYGDPDHSDSNWVSDEDARRALRNLHRLSVVAHDPAAGHRSVRMHAMAQRATLEQADLYGPTGSRA